MKVDPIGVSRGWHNDGHPHQRDEHRVCGSCGVGPNEYHYRLKPKEHTP